MTTLNTGICIVTHFSPPPPPQKKNFFSSTKKSDLDIVT